MAFDIETLDALPPDAFIAATSPWFEGAPRFLARLAAARPFGSAEALFARAEAIALGMPDAEQVELIDAHPRLGASPATVSAASFREQGYDRETTVAIAELDRLNVIYEQQFGFRFCVFVNGRSRAALVPVLEAALDGQRADELGRALRDVVAIARDRWSKADAVLPGDAAPDAATLARAGR
ncbi:MAG TPA: 2-oxo-4-hydroxy-4-carboxy-5-ureidoimidazoline decarboxylase [Candidatus Limnocylindrales bacterium]|nr:2-oxo-4-hydroxy-4-carboxy-5-ureidoimidazoline decarboxylase [Candidatus Limnocylindrales bacterium]